MAAESQNEYIVTYLNRSAVPDDFPLTIHVKPLGAVIAQKALLATVGSAAKDLIIAAQQDPHTPVSEDRRYEQNQIGLVEYMKAGGRNIAAHFPAEPIEYTVLGKALTDAAAHSYTDQLAIYAQLTGPDSFDDKDVQVTAFNRRKLGIAAAIMAHELDHAVVDPEDFNPYIALKLNAARDSWLINQADNETPTLMFGSVDDQGRYVIE